MPRLEASFLLLVLRNRLGGIRRAVDFKTVDAAGALDEGGAVDAGHARIGVSLGAAVRVVDAEQVLAVKGGGKAVMPRAGNGFGAVENGILLGAAKRTGRGLRDGVADRVIRAFCVICRVGQIVESLML